LNKKEKEPREEFWQNPQKGEEQSSTAATNLKKASRLLHRKILFFTPRPDNPTSSFSLLKGLA